MSYVETGNREIWRRRVVDVVTEARRLWNEGDFKGAHDSFLVGADASEELATPDYARWLRGQARRMLVTAWARRKLDATLGPMDVEPDEPPRGEIRQFVISKTMGRVPGMPGRFARVRVSIDRRGRVRIMGAR